MKAQFVNENVKFERGIDPKKAMGLGFVTVILDYHNFQLDEDKLEKGVVKPDMYDEDTAYAVKELNRSGLQYEFIETYGAVEVKITGTRDEMAPFVADYLAEPVGPIKDGFYKWNGINETEFWRLIGY